MEAIGFIRGMLALRRLAWLGKEAHQRLKDRATRGRIEAAFRSSPVYARLLTDQTATKKCVDGVMGFFAIYLDPEALKHTIDRWIKEDGAIGMEVALGGFKYLGSEVLCKAFFNDEEHAKAVWPLYADGYHHLLRMMEISIEAASSVEALPASEPVGADSVLRHFGSPADYPPSTDFISCRNTRLEALLHGRGLEGDEVAHLERAMLLLDVPPEQRWSLDRFGSPLSESLRVQLKWRLETELLGWLGDAEIRHAWFDDPIRENAAKAILETEWGTKPA